MLFRSPRLTSPLCLAIWGRAEATCPASPPLLSPTQPWWIPRVPVDPSTILPRPTPFSGPTLGSALDLEADRLHLPAGDPGMALSPPALNALCLLPVSQSRLSQSPRPNCPHPVPSPQAWRQESFREGGRSGGGSGPGMGTGVGDEPTFLHFLCKSGTVGGKGGKRENQP